ncbi:hypothetical protein CENSYa_0740 [Cenarchaeum symbiosum A]|uniref:Uncharacterized protein n=1 Tax=Cenarchaeum symbiosum (strain A) TaxID=414004 RepID=A0RVK6_CENSY|nr:hypothetical protein CENSYa_0740 [Cenarchaeum symbiosum A]
MRSGLFIIPGIAIPIMLWMTRGESAGLYRILDDISKQQLPKSEMAEMAENIKGIKTESEKTGKVLGSIAGTLEGMNKTLKSIDGKLDGNPGPSGPKRPDQ